MIVIVIENETWMNRMDRILWKKEGGTFLPATPGGGYLITLKQGVGKPLSPLGTVPAKPNQATKGSVVRIIPHS